MFEPTDAEAVVAVWEAAGLIRPWNDPYADISRKHAMDDDLFLVAERAGSVVGSVMVGYDGHRGWIYYLAVVPAHRNHGIGTALVSEAERLLGQRGCPKVNLQVRTDNLDTVRFYEEIGYTPDTVTSLGKRLDA